MGLSFLVPAFLVGLAALAVPVILHLTRRQRSTVVEFPSLMFLERIPYRSMRRRKIRNWLLLLVRAAAMGLLVVAFARPLLTDVDLAAGTVLGPRELVILLDRSYSMAYDGRWDRAVGAAREAAATVQPIDRVSLIVFDAGAQAVMRSSSDLDRLHRSLADVTLGAMGTRYGPALKLAESILSDSNLPNKEVILISDFQRAGWNGDEDVRFPAATRITPVQVGEADADEPENALVSDVELRRGVFSGRERVTVSARISRVGGAEATTIPVTLSIDGREIDAQDVDISAEGAATVSFEPFTLAGSFTRGEIRAEPDGLTPDDAARFVLSPGRTASVLIVQGRTADDRSSLYLERALGISGETPYRVDIRGPTALGAELAERSVVVLSDVSMPAGAVDDLVRYVEQGGGVLLVLGESSRVPDAASQLLPATVGQPVDRLEAGRLGYMDYSHPILEAFGGADGGDFSRARFYRYRSLTPGEGARVLARFDDGAPAIVEGRRGSGRVIVWASSADNFWNDLVLQPLFLPLVHRTVAYLSGVEEERVALAPRGGTIPVPEGTERAFVDLVEAGFYLVRAPGSEEPRPVSVAVNVDVSESDLRLMDPEELVLSVSAARAEDGATADAGSGAVLRAEDLERRQGFWRFILVGVFMLLVLETVMSNRLSRGRPGPGGVNA
jgi:hypothetical protein